MDHFIEAVVATADSVGARLKSTKKINISFDEWNVWYITRYHEVDKITDLETWPIAPRLLEDTYSVIDAVVVGNLLISLLKHADRVTSASLAQLVNVIAPIMTEPGGATWRQTTFFPFAVTSRLAKGVALELKLSSDTYTTAAYGEVNTVDAVATHDAETGDTAIFLVNRALDAPTTVTIDVSHLGDVSIAEVQAIADDDITAANTLDNQNRVALQNNPTAVIADGSLTIELPAVSWTAISLSR
jgi:alpha-N-arabinofuranosidase